MRFWCNLAIFLLSRSEIRVGATAAALLLILSTGVGLVLSHGVEAYASIPTVPASSHPVLRPQLISAPTPVSPLPEVVGLQDLTPEQALAANAAIPFATLPNPPAKPFRMMEAADEDKIRAETCLAQAVYYEASFEPVAGEQAVAQVVLNRLRHPVYPKTVCGVVFQGSDQKTGCQFTFTCDGALGRPPEEKAWARAIAVAQAALNGYVMKAVGEATHYHAQYVVPYWSPSLVKLTQIGQHIFYRWTGTFGQPPAFGGQYAGNEPGAATEVAAIAPLVPMEKLAVDFGAPAANGGPVTGTPAARGESAAAPGPATAATSTPEASPAPVQLARAEVAPVQAAPPQVAPVKPVFLPAESLVPRPKWKPF